MSQQDFLKEFIESEISKGLSFKSDIGVTPDNIRDYIIEPKEVLVTITIGLKPKIMWIVLLLPHDKNQRFVLYEPVDKYWGVAMIINAAEYKLIYKAPTLNELLDHL